MAVAYPQLNVKVAGSHGGISIGEDGASQQSVEDIALACSLPGFVVCVPSDEHQMRAAVKAAYRHDGPVYIRSGRPKAPLVYQEEPSFQFGKANRIREGTDVTVIANGLMVAAGIVAHEKLKADGINVRVVDMATAAPRAVLAARASTLGYVSQFLRVVPRVAARDIVAEPLVAAGMARDEAAARAEALLRRLNLPRRLWDLPPATFSGGEQQRVNIARGFISDLPILLLDEPTASLDAANRAVVVELVAEKKHQGVAMVAIVHDDEIRHLIADRIVDVTSFAAAA